MFSTWLGMVLLFAFFGMLAFVILKAAPRGSTFEKKRAEARAKKLEDAQKENSAALTTYAWVDKSKGIARIPINDAMKLTAAELAQKKPAVAGPIALPSPAAAPQTSPAVSPASAAATPAPDASGTPKPASVAGPDSANRNQPAAAANPPPAPPGTQPGPGASPAAPAPPASAQAPVSPSPSPSPSAPGTPLPVRGKTP